MTWKGEGGRRGERGAGGGWEKLRCGQSVVVGRFLPEVKSGARVGVFTLACLRLSRTPHALHSVLGPSGPLRHSGVVCVLQCAHRLPGMPGSIPVAGTSNSSIPNSMVSLILCYGEVGRRRGSEMRLGTGVWEEPHAKQGEAAAPPTGGAAGKGGGRGHSCGDKPRN